MPWWAPVVALAALAGLLAWPVISGGLGGSSGDANEADAAISDDGPIDPARPADATAASAVERAPTIERARPDVGDPVAPGAVGLSVFVGSATELVRIDLDTGVQRAFEARGRPAHITGGWLVVADSDGGATRFVDTNDPEGRLRRTIEEPQAWLLGAGRAIEPGQLWVLVDTNNSSVTEWRLVDLDSQAVLRTVSVDGPFTRDILVDDGAVQLQPQFTSASDGSLFVLGDASTSDEATSYEPLGPGRLLAATDDALLIERCDEPVRCEAHWYGRDGQTRLDDDAVTNESLLVSQVRSSTDREVVAWSDPFGGGVVVRDMGTDRTYVFDATWEPALPSVSADGRYVVGVDTAPFLLDVETGEVTPLPVSTSLRRGNVSVLLFERTDDGLTPAPDEDSPGAGDAGS